MALRAAGRLEGTRLRRCWDAGRLGSKDRCQMSEKTVASDCFEIPELGPPSFRIHASQLPGLLASQQRETASHCCQMDKIV